MTAALCVIGPDAYPAQVVGGGSAGVRPFTAVSYLEGLAGYLGGKATVYYERGIPSLAELADATAFSTDEGGKRVPALFEAWYPGQEGGTALAQLLFGEYAPSGKLPISFERRWEDNAVHDSYYPKGAEKKVAYAEGLFLGYRHFDKTGIKPQFPFGFGLSYTTFAYKNLSITPAHTAGDQMVTVSFDVINTGHRAGAEVVRSVHRRTASERPTAGKGTEGIHKGSTESERNPTCRSSARPEGILLLR
jgi:hypothetical protein